MAAIVAAISNAFIITYLFVLRPATPSAPSSACSLRIDTAKIGQHVLAADDRPELAARLIDHRADDGAVGRIDEERNRVAILAIAVDDTVLGRRKTTVGPALQQIGDIDHEGAVDGRHSDPIAALVADLQSSE